MTETTLQGNQLVILDATGDTRIPWTTDAERDYAREIFDSYRRRGFMAYSVTGGAGGTAVKELVPGPVVLAPPIVGG